MIEFSLTVKNDDMSKAKRAEVRLNGRTDDLIELIHQAMTVDPRIAEILLIATHEFSEENRTNESINN